MVLNINFILFNIIIKLKVNLRCKKFLIKSKFKFYFLINLFAHQLKVLA